MAGQLLQAARATRLKTTGWTVTVLALAMTAACGCSAGSARLPPLGSSDQLPSEFRPCPSEDFGDAHFEVDGTSVVIVLSDGEYPVVDLGPYRSVRGDPAHLEDSSGAVVAVEGQVRSVFGTFGRDRRVGICMILPLDHPDA